jgi:hypothetical protein
MGQAKINQRGAFAPALVEEWESDDCINFAIALARLTGWILHVDWWAAGTEWQEGKDVQEMTPLRAYVGDNRDQVFDVRGIKSLFEFNERVMVRLARNAAHGPGSIYTRFYDEARLANLPLKSQPDETKILTAMEAIQANQHFLGRIPIRSALAIPALDAAKFTYGLCAPFAEAMRTMTELPPIALLAVRFSPLFEGTRRGQSGYFHSVVLHPDGTGEDSWGRASLEDIASRFGVIEFTTSSAEHKAVVERLKQSSLERFTQAQEDAMGLIRRYRAQ